MKELLRQLLILAAILIGIVASSLPAAFFLQSGDSSASGVKKVSETPDAAAEHPIQLVREPDDSLTFVKETNRQRDQRRKVAN